VVLASVAAGLPGPVGAPSTWDDLTSLRRSTADLRGLGFSGRACLYPAQVEIVDEVFQPTPEELTAARDLVDRYAAAQRDGAGVTGRDAHGHPIGEARIRRARRTLGRA
jgi:citrate lyase subunit beta/citryl-CoA lyase